MTVKVSPKYQVVIPESVRQQTGIKPGMEVNVLVKSGVIYVIPTKSIEEVAKALAGKFSPEDLKEFREKADRKL